MSKRLQVRLPDAEMDEIRCLAQRDKMTVSAWARKVLRNACARQTKLNAVCEATQYSFPTADIHQMLAEIEQGYQSSNHDRW